MSMKAVQSSAGRANEQLHIPYLPLLLQSTLEYIIPAASSEIFGEVINRGSMVELQSELLMLFSVGTSAATKEGVDAIHGDNTIHFQPSRMDDSVGETANVAEIQLGILIGLHCCLDKGGELLFYRDHKNNELLFANAFVHTLLFALVNPVSRSKGHAPAAGIFFTEPVLECALALLCR